MTRLRRTFSNTVANALTRSTQHTSTPEKRRKRQVPKRVVRLEQRSSPPVMVRGDLAGLLAPRKKRARSRRRFDLALGVPGAEMRLPSLPFVSVGWRLLSGLLVIGFGTLLYQAWNSPQFRVAEPQISGLQRVGQADVLAVMGVVGEPVFTLDAGQIKERLLAAFPEFSSVEVGIDVPNQLTVRVVERVPILAWVQGGQIEMIDADGFAFPQRNQADLGSLVVVESNTLPPSPGPPDQAGSIRLMPVEMVSAILSMSAQAPPQTRLIYDPQRGLGWREPQGWEVYFGDVRDISIKLRVYKAIVTRLQQEATTPVLISVEHVDAPYYRLER